MQSIGRSFLTITLALLCGACAVQAERNGNAPLLNSERIQHQFGSYGIEVLFDNGQVRHSSLFSHSPTGEEKRITRTAAIVIYSDPGQPVLSDELQAIRNGGSLGQVLKANGWEVVKATLHVGELPAHPARSTIYRAMHLVKPESLAIHVYQLNAVKLTQSYPVAVIAEIHHPDYLNSTDLARIAAAEEDEPLSLPLSSNDERMTRVIAEINKWGKQNASSTAGNDLLPPAQATNP